MIDLAETNPYVIIFRKIPTCLIDYFINSNKSVYYFIFHDFFWIQKGASEAIFQPDWSDLMISKRNAGEDLVSIFLL